MRCVSKIWNIKIHYIYMYIWTIRFLVVLATSLWRHPDNLDCLTYHLNNPEWLNERLSKSFQITFIVITMKHCTFRIHKSGVILRSWSLTGWYFHYLFILRHHFLSLFLSSQIPRISIFEYYLFEIILNLDYDMKTITSFIG